MGARPIGRGPIHATARVVLGVAAILLFTIGVSLVASGDDGFEIVVPVETVVYAPQGSTTELASEPVPAELVGQTCAVTARAENQSSVHPGNDLIVESGTRVVLEDVEAEAGGVVTSTDTMALADSIVIALVMGPDEVFSAGLDVLLDCPPDSTTSSTTTSVPETTTSTGMETTTTEILSSTTTVKPSTTTTGPSTTSTTTPGTTTTSIPATTTSTDEVLVYTGPPDPTLALPAIALVAMGVLLLMGERLLAMERGILTRPARRCEHCSRAAEFTTPHGKLCRLHTKRALNDDEALWMPTKLKRQKGE